MKAYQSHHVVYAAIIERVNVTPPPHEQAAAEDRVTELHLEGGLVVTVDAAWHAKHQPNPGEFFVKYEDGYTSKCPAEAFLRNHHEVEVPAVAETIEAAAGEGAEATTQPPEGEYFTGSNAEDTAPLPQEQQPEPVDGEAAADAEPTSEDQPPAFTSEAPEAVGVDLGADPAPGETAEEEPADDHDGKVTA